MDGVAPWRAGLSSAALEDSVLGDFDSCGGAVWAGGGICGGCGAAAVGTFGPPLSKHHYQPKNNTINNSQRARRQALWPDWGSLSPSV